jgi:pyruvate kinase
MLTSLKHELLRRRRTKIVATLGPASSDAVMIEKLIHAGANVFRLNMSHGEHATHEKTFQTIREVSLRLKEPVAVLADLCGPKIRAGKFEGGSIILKDGERVTVTTREVMGSAGLIPSQYHALAEDVKKGDRILLDDGLIELRVEQVQKTEIACTVVNGGALKDRKGMNLPGVNVSAPSLTEKDRLDAAFALKLGVDYVALSFVRRASDVLELREIVNGMKSGAQIISKIEKPEALDNIEAILDVTDGIMVARGDLGVELPPERVPIVQRELGKAARLRNKPVIIATQMLESMIEHPRPTRAEVSDVSHAVFSGTDAVMLSAETASGRYPVEAVTMMDHVARQVEGWQWSAGFFGMLQESDGSPPIEVNKAVARAVSGLSRDLHVRTIVVFSRTGETAKVVSHSRPAAPIVAATTDLATARRMSLLWGLAPCVVSNEEIKERHAVSRRIARDMGLAEDGQHILMVSGIKTQTGQGNEPMITVLRA